MDCWDGTDAEYKNEPIIYHGYTATSKILFKDVLIEAVKPYAFYKSKYPLILSIENHCSIEFHDKMANYFEDILGDLLYIEPVQEHETQLPSPEQLSKKILVKGKKTFSPNTIGTIQLCITYHLIIYTHGQYICLLRILL